MTLETVPFASIALYSPRIAQNVGAVGRLCAATGAPLHVIRPIPFRLDDRALKRTAMDYWDHVTLGIHDSLDELTASESRIWLFTTQAEQLYTEVCYQPGDILLFGNEPHGVPDSVHAMLGSERSVRIPILQPAARSLNLATAAAVGLYEAYRQFRQASHAQRREPG